MTEEELIKDIAWKIQKFPYNPKLQLNAEEIAVEIIKTIREAGWHPREETIEVLKFFCGMCKLNTDNEDDV